MAAQNRALRRTLKAVSIFGNSSLPLTGSLEGKQLLDVLMIGKRVHTFGLVEFRWAAAYFSSFWPLCRYCLGLLVKIQ
jgi:hypothetical protein